MYVLELIELSNSTLSNIKGFQSEKVNLSIVINRTEFEKIMYGRNSLDEVVNSGKVKVVGDLKALDQLKSLLVQFNADFEIIPGTKSS